MTALYDPRPSALTPGTVSTDIDPFVHHPELRDKIRDPSTCWARNYLDERLVKLGVPPDWRHTDTRREQMRRETFTGRAADDPWLFAYGSLMWDPGIRFADRASPTSRHN